MLKLVPQDLKEPELTAKWEMELAKIAKKEQKSNIFIKWNKKIYSFFIDEISSSEPNSNTIILLLKMSRMQSFHVRS